MNTATDEPALDSQPATLKPVGQALPPGALQLPPVADAKLIKPVRIQRGHRGKIARLPGPLRDIVNRMLRNNIPYSRIPTSPIITICQNPFDCMSVAPCR